LPDELAVVVLSEVKALKAIQQGGERRRKGDGDGLVSRPDGDIKDVDVKINGLVGIDRLNEFSAAHQFT